MFVTARRQIEDGLYVQGGCPKDWDGALVHACKRPCFVERVGTPDPTSPFYLSFEEGPELWLNIVDADHKGMFPRELFECFLGWIERHREQEVLIHCNEGRSRSPALAMLALVARGEIAPGFDEAVEEYEFLDPKVRRYTGIMSYLEEDWDYLLGAIR